MRLWLRLAVVLGMIAIVVTIGTGVFWIYNHQSNLVPPTFAELPTLTANAYVHAGANGTVVVEAANFHDAIRSLGFAHALNHAWTMAIWRQAAAGQLANWLGGPALAGDRLTRQLGLAELAQASFIELPAEDRLFLEAYVDGINAAWPLATAKAEMLLLDKEPAAWEPWQVLSIERLLAWLSEPVLRGCMPDVDLCLGDQALRASLHVYGFEHSVAWQRSGGDRTVLYQRHVTGAYARQVYQEVTLRIAGWQPIRGASIIGTPFFPAASSDSSAWALMLSSPRFLDKAKPAIRQLARITAADSNEHLTTFTRANGQLTIGSSREALIWHGLMPQTDTDAWRALLQRNPAAFTLLRGDGIRTDVHQRPTVSGQPRVQDLHPRGVLVGNSQDAIGIAQFIENRTDTVPNVELWTRDLRSQWSATMLAARLNAIEKSSNTTPVIGTAMAYLQSWDHQYQDYSIGATIFSEWMRSREPDLADALTEAVIRLTHRFGADQSQWRWDRMHTERRFFVVPKSLQTQLFAPLSWPATGHSTTLLWGGETIAGNPVPSAVWEMWMDLNPGAPVYVRRRHIDLSALLGRSVAETADPVIFGLPSATLRTTVLHP